MKAHLMIYSAAFLCVSFPAQAQPADDSTPEAAEAEFSTNAPDATMPDGTQVPAEEVDEPTKTSEPAREEAPINQADANLLPSASADGCELHLWPAKRMRSVTTGWLGGGLLDLAMQSGTDANNKTLMASALDSPTQLDALLELDLRHLLELSPGTTLVRHEIPVDRKTMNKVKNRRSDSTANCYMELIVADVSYQKAALIGRSLRTLFMFRDFGDDQVIDRQYKAWGANGLKLFPPKEGEDAIAALDELAIVYRRNFEEYAANARRSFALKR